MKNLTLTAAFAECGAELRNRLNCYSAIAEDGSVVVACWKHRFKEKADGTLSYDIRDFAEWRKNPAGRNLLKQHLEYAFGEDRPVRMVLVTPIERKNPPVAGTTGRDIPKTYSVEKDLVGKVVTINDDSFVIDFQRT